MTLSDLLARLRPKDRTAASAADALAETERARTLALARIADMEGRRAGVLLDMEPAAVAAFEADLAAARAEAERLAVIGAELALRRDQAAKAERLAAAEAAHAEAESLAAELAKDIGQDVPALAERMAGLIERERAALDAIGRARTMALAAGIDRPAPLAPLARVVGATSVTLRECVVVPNVEAPWPRGFGGPGPSWALHPNNR